MSLRGVGMDNADTDFSVSQFLPGLASWVLKVEGDDESGGYNDAA
jgi:hypothetical protein